MCFAWISEQKSDFFLYTAITSVFITKAENVFCAVRPGSLNQTDRVSSLKGLMSSCRLHQVALRLGRRQIFPKLLFQKFILQLLQISPLCAWFDCITGSFNSYKCQSSGQLPLLRSGHLHHSKPSLHHTKYRPAVTTWTATAKTS
jgi:hypothetical protein